MMSTKQIVYSAPASIGLLAIILSFDVISAGKTPINGYNFGNNTTNINYLNQTRDMHQTLLKRDKRHYLIWNGISKSVLGMLMPVETRDRVNWRTLNMAHNFQAQYMVLPRIVFPWNLFSRALDEQKRKSDEDNAFGLDGSRAIVYSILEKILDAKNRNGRDCMLKAICEAQTDPIQRRSVFEEIVHVVLTPNKGEVDDSYLDAKNAGSFRADCEDLYPKCKPGQGLIDTVSYYF